MARDILRRCTFRPYRSGYGPTFHLTTWDSCKPQQRYYGLRETIGYRLTMREGRVTTVLFEAEDFGPSPMHAIDSDASVRALMGFLTLRPGDTDADYFDAYTDTQRRFCELHAESLAACYWRGKMLTED